MVMRGEDRQDKSADRMCVEVGRNITDPKPAIGIAVIFVRADQRLERMCVPLGPATELGEQFGLAATGVEVERIEEVAVDDGIGRRYFDGPPERGNGLLKLPFFLQDGAKIADRFGIIGFQLNGALEGGSGLIQLAVVHQGDAEIIVGFGAIGLELDCASAQRDRLVNTANRVHEAAKIAIRAPVVRVELSGLPKCGDCQAELSLLL